MHYEYIIYIINDEKKIEYQRQMQQRWFDVPVTKFDLNNSKDICARRKLMSKKQM